MPTAKPLPPLETLQALFTYCPETGVLTHRTAGSRHSAGAPVGHRQPSGYLRARVQGHTHAVHRICWALQHGCDPFPYQIDHLNRNRADNRARNLRRVTQAQNRANCTGAPLHTYIDAHMPI